MKKCTWSESLDLMVNHGKKMVADYFKYTKYSYFDINLKKLVCVCFFNDTTYDLLVDDIDHKSKWVEYKEEI